MTKEENISTLNEHLEHWKRLLSEKICDQDEGEKTIDALQNAIKALEQEPCENCCSGNQIEKAKLCQKSYLAGMEHKQEPCDDAISRQAAINAAIDGADKWDGGFNREREKCIREEIEKLLSVTSQPCEDAISRQAVLDVIEREQFKGDAISEIEKLPSVTPQPKMGKWKAFTHSAYHGNDEDGEPIWREVTVYHCNLCNRRTVIKEKYCPNCGAKMENEI